MVLSCARVTVNTSLDLAVTFTISKLLDAAPERLLWGSDWPHPQYFKPMPNDVGLLDMLLDWIPNEQTRKLILVDNPADLFNFPELG